jgi:endonuclease/exonuclease/phosphatase (EEP) superfamily protein YafD
MEIAILVYCGLLALFTILPWIRSDYWIFRVCEYPRWQKLVFSLVALAVIPFVYSPGEPLFMWLMIAMFLNAVYLFSLIFPFTKLSRLQVEAAHGANDDESIRVTTSNVLQFNKDHAGCVREFQKADPDLFVLLEVNRDWLDGITELTDNYPYTIEIPLENTYGMCMYSRLEIVDSKVRYLVEDDIPSVEALVKLKSGRLIRVFAVHPSPPAPAINPTSTERDAELLKVADFAKQSKEPVIVVGDLNDVAWSYTTKLFLKISGLLDPRRGRGMYNTFNARNFIFRFPLDHAFISGHFRLRELRKLGNFHSDHFPMMVHVQYEGDARSEQKPLKVKPEDRKLAKEKKAKR